MSLDLIRNNFVLFLEIISKMSDDHDARTIHCANLNADKITEELLYELFLQVIYH